MNDERATSIGSARSPRSVGWSAARSPVSFPAFAAAVAFAAVLAAGASAARAQAPGGDAEPDAEVAAPPRVLSAGSEIASDRELGARVGVTTGGRVTPGGVRVAGVYLYQLSDADWFEGALGFTFGSGAANCFLDREGAFLCNHGPLSGAAVEVAVGIRRFIAPRDRFAPYARVQVGGRLVRFGDDGVLGVAVPVIVGAGVRAKVSDLVAVGADAALEAGVGWFDRGLGAEPQIGLQIAGAVEFRLR